MLSLRAAVFVSGTQHIGRAMRHLDLIDQEHLAARVLRAQTLSFRQQDFVQAAKAAGESNWRIILSEILPNEAPIVATSFVVAIS